MFPSELATGLCSLNPHVDRLKVVDVDHCVAIGGGVVVVVVVLVVAVSAYDVRARFEGAC